MGLLRELSSAQTNNSELRCAEKIRPSISQAIGSEYVFRWSLPQRAAPTTRVRFSPEAEVRYLHRTNGRIKKFADFFLVFLCLPTLPLLMGLSFPFPNPSV